MKLIDTHCHLYATEFNADREQMIIHAKNTGVTACFLPNINLETVSLTNKMAEDYPGFIYPMMGIHPCDIKEEWAAEWDRIKEEFTFRKYYGVGEIGIDLYWDKTYINQQKEAFETQCLYALQNQLPVSIHSRDATHICLDILKQQTLKGLTGVFHCFTGSKEEATQIINLGLHLGIGGVVTYKNTNLRETLKVIEPQHLVIETDAPYLPPVPYRGKRNEPAYLLEILNTIAQVYSKSPLEMSGILYENSQRVFGHLSESNI